MSLLLFFVLLLTLIILLIIIFRFTGVLDQNEPVKISPEQNEFSIPAPWYWLTKQDPNNSNIYLPADDVIFNNPEVKGIWNDETYTFKYDYKGLISGVGPNGEILDPSYFGSNGKSKLVGYGELDNYCTTYTFLSLYSNVPSSGKYSILNACQDQPLEGNGTPGSCYKSTIEDKDGCYDGDQLLAIEAVNGCAGQTTFGSTTGDLCRGQDGQMNEVNTKQIFFTNCASSTDFDLPKCNAILGFLVLGTIPNNSICISGPLYNKSGTGYVTNTTPAIVEKCSLTNIYKGYPNQLWRITPYSYETGKFVYNTGGSFLRIYSRSTGLCLGPSFNLNDVGDILPNQPIPGPLQLISCDTLKNSKGNIYWWYVLPQINQPPPYEQDEDGLDIVMTVKPQLIFISDPNIIPKTITWEFIVKNPNLLSVQPINGLAECQKLIIEQIEISSEPITEYPNYIFTYINYTHSNYIA
jgi:hypothetical protein